MTMKDQNDSKDDEDGQDSGAVAIRSLTDLGWQPAREAERTDADDPGGPASIPARVIAIHRDRIIAHDGATECRAVLGRHWYRLAQRERPTVGDWVLLDPTREKIYALLRRSTLLTRLGAGQETQEQAIAANINTLFLVTSCNDEFNESRIERYLALARASRIPAVLILTKSDLSDQPDAFVERARKIDPELPIETVNALDPASAEGVRAWLRPQETIAMVGSSGVGKSTLLNCLAGHEVQLTGGIREDDNAGRHTTTHRSLHLLAGGTLILDSPGMRELGMANSAPSIRDMFEDIEALMLTCRFSDCAHQHEPGCAIQAAIADESLDSRRYSNYRKLAEEEARNTRTLAENRREKRRDSKRYKNAKDGKKKWSKDTRL
jgi:ribosome biogenesis GTPase